MFTVKHKNLKIITLVGVTIAAVFATRLYIVDNVPIRTTGSDVADAAKAGDVDYAMQKSKRLLALLKEADWQDYRLPLEAMQLPDRRFCEDRFFRSDNMTSFFIMQPKAVGPEPASDIKADDLAFYSSIYVRQNTSYYKGDKARSKPSGFYIVGLKNGSVYKVPVEQARLIPGETHKTVMAFPGMKAYDVNAPKLPFVEFANGPGSQEKQAAYVRAVTGPCAGCTP